MDGEFVVLAHGGRSVERLTGEQARELAEALETVATAGTNAMSSQVGRSL